MMTNFEVGQTVYYAKFQWLPRGLIVKIASGVIFANEDKDTPILNIDNGTSYDTEYPSDCFLTQEEAQNDARNKLVQSEKHFREQAKCVKVMAKMKWTNGEIKYEL